MHGAAAFSMIMLQCGILFTCGVLDGEREIGRSSLSQKPQQSAWFPAVFQFAASERTCASDEVALQVEPDEASKRDLARFQGEWIAVAVEREGKPVAADDVKKLDIRLIIRGSEFMLMPLASKGPEHFPFGTFKLHATKEPKAIDLAVAPFFSGMKAHTELGIYAFEGDRLKLLRGLPGKERPTAFETTRKLGLEIVVFQRAKK